ncbi:MAG TPA: lactonase family protein [Chloroflexia bacterium]|nr:lactonase family protein [Chloroflexia bacterium]
MTPPQLLYAGSYAAADQPGIYAFTFDAATGRLAGQGSWAGIAHPSFLAIHPHRPWLFAVSETSTAEDGVAGAVWALRRRPGPAILEPINHQASGGDSPCHLAVDATGRWLLVANYGTGSVGLLPIAADGALGPAADLVQHHGRGPHPVRQAGPHAHSATFAPDGRFVLVADLGLDAVLVYALDPVAGRLQPQTQVPTRPGAGPRHLAFHPGGRHVYVANELDNTLAVYAYDAARGALQEQQVVATLPPAATASTVADIHLSAAGNRVYVSNRGHDSIAVFDVAANGQLERGSFLPCGGRWPRNFAIAPGGQFLLVANQHSDALAVLPLGDSGSTLGAPRARAVIPGVACVQFAGAA